MAETDQGTVQLGRIFRRPGDGDDAFRVQLVSGEDSINVKFQRKASPRLVKFILDHIGDVPVEPRTKTPSDSEED